jgi:hypothetical protein
MHDLYLDAGAQHTGRITQISGPKHEEDMKKIVTMSFPFPCTNMKDIFEQYPLLRIFIEEVENTRLCGYAKVVVTISFISSQCSGSKGRPPEDADARIHVGTNKQPLSRNRDCHLSHPRQSTSSPRPLFGKFLMLNHLIYCPVPFVLPWIEEETNRCVVLR